ncbi:site-specific recombinase XerD [Mucilaginibacter gracilis]|uniref:Site-specific recombinase XerD n=1 Tax=Mucilaginibacter gracilis TaxID=423350 RepID=A0A495J0C8_9SPHI|nr:site-specific integrase [Mucilaginibacter gracilis]RKR81818.1 site-specific recombinase XerD [Mucilaginibacter gracilis]
MKINFNVLFYLKRPKNYQSGEVPIYLRITVEGKRSEVTTGRSCEPETWNVYAGRVMGNKEDARVLNAYLDSLQSKIKDAHYLLSETNEPICAESLRNKFLGKAEKPKFLLHVFEEHNRKVEALLNNGFEYSTLKGYRSSLNHLRKFLKHKFNISDIELSRVDYQFVTAYEFYLRTRCKCSATTCAKYLKHLKKITNECLAYRWITHDPFAHYRSKAKPTEKTYLNQDDLDKMMNKDLHLERLAQVRDIFLFCCYTGLAYIDIQKLKRSEIVRGVDHEQWVFTQRKKTGTATRIPMLPPALAIMERYKDHPICEDKGLVLPVCSNQKINAYLKEVATICGVTKPVTFHTARHTFATTVTLSNGVPIESVSKMLGHTNIKTTQHYAKILDLKVSDDMAQLKKKYYERSTNA